MQNKNKKKYILKDDKGTQFCITAFSINEAKSIARTEGATGYLDFICGEVTAVLPEEYQTPSLFNHE